MPLATSRRSLWRLIPATVALAASASAQTAVPAIRSVVNGASFAPGIAAGSWITIYGSNLSATTRGWAQSDFSGNRLPVTLDGVSVQVNGRPAMVAYVSPTQINALAGEDRSVGPVAVVVTSARGASAPATAQMQRYAPALFTYSANSRTYASASHPDNTLVGAAGILGSRGVTAPAQVGADIALWCTGLGPTDPAVDPAVLFSKPAPLAAPPDLRVLIGGAEASVTYAGVTGSGLYQVNVRVPETSEGDRLVEVLIGGQRSQANVYLNVRRPPPIPKITSLSHNDLVWGQAPSFSVRGENLTGATRVSIEPPEGLKVANVRASSTSVSFDLTVEGGAPEGERTITVSSATATSNSATFSVRRGNPQLSRVGPPVVHPDRWYSSWWPAYDSPSRFVVQGQDLAGVGSFEVLPGDGITALPGVPGSTGINGVLVVAPDATPGIRRVAAVSPGGRSNEVTFEVQPAPVTAPVISDLRLDSSRDTGRSIVYTGRFSFQDADGDIRSGSDGAKVGLMQFLPTTGSSYITTVTGSGSYLDKAGQQSGTIEFRIEEPYFIGFVLRGQIRILVALRDAAGNLSNSLQAVVPLWHVRFL